MAEMDKKAIVAKALYEKKLRDMVNADYAQAPLTDAQQGQAAGNSAYNSVVPELNDILKNGKTMMSESERQMFMKMNDQEKQDFLKAKNMGE